MRKISSFVIVASLILAAVGIGVWAASTTTSHRATTVVGPPEGGGCRPVYSGAGAASFRRERCASLS